MRYGCRWEATGSDSEGFVLETSDGEYRCRAVVFAVGVTTPWTARSPASTEPRTTSDVRRADEYDGRSVFIVGKRNSAFEIANNLLPWARRIVLASPRAIRTDVLGHSPLRTRYLQPLDEHVRGGSGRRSSTRRSSGSSGLWTAFACTRSGRRGTGRSSSIATK